MPRQRRIVMLDVPYHITHRGNRRGDVFFETQDRDDYKDLLLVYATRNELQVWAYCLMTNHVHLLGVPEAKESLARTMGQTHGRFAQVQNEKYGWAGHLWGNRYFATPLDEEHLWAAVRYVELNPVRAGLVTRAEEYPWSSARAHATGEHDRLLSPNRPFPGWVEDWANWLSRGLSEDEVERLRRHLRSGKAARGKIK